MKTIRYKQIVEVVEYYEVDYTRRDFQYDCECFKIENFTYEDLCGILDGSIEDRLISVEEFYCNENGDVILGPRFVSAKEFFTRMMTDAAFEYGSDDRVEVGTPQREVSFF